ncbi:MAG: galactokinase [Verrucomicrobia bacterium]|nr:galactokinase [Verrucomicrobiota bacterium]
MNPTLIETIKQAHVKRFGQPPAVVAYAPGRVEILGNHTDYNEGFVLSAAIDLGVGLALSSAGSASCTMQALDIPEEICFDLPVTAPVKRPLWVNYVRGVVNKLGALGRIEPGFQATFAGDIPMGAGLSSSAALEIAAALALSRLYKISAAPLELAKIGQAAENDFTGAHCGLLDQISSLYGEPEALVFTDFRSLKVEAVPLTADICFLLADTRVKHCLAGSAKALPRLRRRLRRGKRPGEVASAYNERRAQCERASAFFASVLDHPVTALRDVSRDEWNAFAARLDPITARRAAHVIEENARVLEANRFLRSGNVRAFGELMFQSHNSSQTNFENSCPELDFIVAQARMLPRVLGARLSGGGFGGSVVLMLHPCDADQVGQTLASAYVHKFGHTCATRVIRPAAGARVL